MQKAFFGGTDPSGGDLSRENQLQRVIQEYMIPSSRQITTSLMLLGTGASARLPSVDEVVRPVGSCTIASSRRDMMVEGTGF
jgi:hypothetical protein